MRRECPVSESQKRVPWPRAHEVRAKNSQSVVFAIEECMDFVLPRLVVYGRPGEVSVPLEPDELDGLIDFLSIVRSVANALEHERREMREREALLFAPNNLERVRMDPEGEA